MVVFVSGYPDVGVARPLGCALKEMAFTSSLAQLVAMAGLAAVAYTTREPAGDIERLLEDGVRLFAEPFDKLLATLERREEIARQYEEIPETFVWDENDGLTYE